jgi:hypothetical protein
MRNNGIIVDASVCSHPIPGKAICPLPMRCIAVRPAEQLKVATAVLWRVDVGIEVKLAGCALVSHNNTSWTYLFESIFLRAVEPSR